MHRIPVPLPLSGLRAVNVYVVDAPAGPVLVDAGWSGPDALDTLTRGLATIGVALDDLDRIVVTHAHHDHYTQALAVRRARPVEVLLGRGEVASVPAMAARGDAPAPQLALLRRAGAADLALRFEPVIEKADLEDDAPWGYPDRWLDDGDVVATGDRELQVRATPGHTRGHIVLRDAALGALFAGDHVLPHITPSIGYERAPEPAPLRSYLDSLRLVRDMPDTLLLPAHGPVGRSVYTRVDELLLHHEQRLEASLDQVVGGRETAHQVAGGLPWTRQARRIDQLETEHAALAVLEIAAHLDVLVDLGRLVADEQDGVRRYAPT